MKYLINLSYDGSKFYGFQSQKTEITVASELERGLSKIFNNKIKVIGASRTDKKVHAYDAYAHFEGKEIDVNKLKYSMNSLIDKSIYIKGIKEVDENFHARYSVKNKEYLYKINTGDYNPFERNYVLQYNKKINLTLLKRASKLIEGKHNFKSFTSDNTKNNYVRTIDYIRIKKDKDYVYVFIKAKGFLRYMVKIIIGLLLAINEEKKSISDIQKIFESRDRSKNVVAAPAEGLYLNKINYLK